MRVAAPRLSIDGGACQRHDGLDTKERVGFDPRLLGAGLGSIGWGFPWVHPEPKCLGWSGSFRVLSLKTRWIHLRRWTNQENHHRGRVASQPTRSSRSTKQEDEASERNRRAVQNTMAGKRGKGSLQSGGPKHSGDAKRGSEGKGGDQSQRKASTVRRLNMYRTRATRDAKGKVISEDLQSKDLPNSRVAPDRRWFGNSRIVSQKQLEALRVANQKQKLDPRTAVLSVQRLQWDKLQAKQDNQNVGAANLVAGRIKRELEPKNCLRRKKPRLSADILQKLEGAIPLTTNSEGEMDFQAGEVEDDGHEGNDIPSSVQKGQSKRIWSELFKVIDSSDVLIEVLDARDPMGTRCKHLEKKVSEIGKQKHIVLLLNKCDLVSILSH